MTRYAWQNYKTYAWGKNELSTDSEGVVDGTHSLGLTIVDSLDTLYLMNLTSELQDATDWIRNNFTINVNGQVSALQLNVRFIGGFLSAYTLTKEKVFDYFETAGFYE
jgi:hypothetical protein